jgi:hypothetical protein
LGQEFVDGQDIVAQLAENCVSQRQQHLLAMTVFLEPIPARF